MAGQLTPAMPHKVRASVETGRLVGLEYDSIASFKAIPFAAPPVGPRRWRPPEPAAKWDGERTADCFGPAPVQPQPPRNSIMFHTNFADRRALVMSEDCLTVNVWTPEVSAGARLPVMVWIHGGGNRYGHGSQEIHDGAAMARRGVVVVTLNHRLGALGFLAHPDLAAADREEASGNYGLLDIVAALEWVQRNIVSFGGDPAAVTVAGNSAGAAHITHLMASTHTRSLFRAAIAQSSSGVFRAEGPLKSQEAAQAEGLSYAASFGSPSIGHLRQVSGVELAVKGHFGPVIDGRLLTEPSDDAFLTGRQKTVPLLAGTVKDEGSNYTRQTDAAELRARVAALPDGQRFEAQYPVDDANVARSARLWVGESRFVYPVWRWAATHRRTAGAPTWLYRFEHAPPLPADIDLAPPHDGGPGFGVYHTSELLYTSDNLKCRSWPWAEADHQLAATMADTWARFVTDLNPNGAGLPNWPTLDDPDGENVMVFDFRPHVATPERLAALHMLDELPRPL